ncbi:CPBP family intramembrane glutamic endopeptidase [Niameybacter massiliensis]|nr:type II CAAX endopeptidase family protein [Niameybacter massiliensis]
MREAGEEMNTISMVLSAIIQVILLSVIPFIWWFLTARKKEHFFSWVGLKKPEIQGSRVKLIFLILIVSIVYIVLMLIVMTQLMDGTNTATTQFEGQGWGVVPSILIFAIIQTGLSEEIFFRGFLGKRLIHKFGFNVGNTIQAILFGMIHGIPFGLMTGNVLITILLILLPGSIGWIQGWMNEKRSSGSIIPSWSTHAIMNILSALSSAF